MLQSILEKLFNKITIDRVLINKDSSIQNSKLVIEHEDIKKQVTKHFEEQFKRKWHGFNSLEVTVEEWFTVVEKTQNDTALGISNNRYILFKKVSLSVVQRF
ncbi:14590_t:CDS:2, partial [Gigaspora margarita]